MLAGFQDYFGRYIDLAEEDIRLLSGLIEMRTYDKRVRIVDIGEIEQYLSFVTKGLLRKYFIRDKEEVITQIIKEGEVVVSSVSYFSNTPSRYIIETIEPTTVVSLTQANLEKLFAMGDKWEKMGRLMMTDFLVEREYWLLDNINCTPRQRFFRFIKEEPELLKRVPQKWLASYLNIKPETFSRLKLLIGHNGTEVIRDKVKKLTGSPGK
jgi:CRP-like cAMP-binding protein